MPQKKAVVLISGGADSATVLAIAKDMGYTCYALSFNYGQKTIAELNAAKEIANLQGVAEHIIINVSELSKLCKSALTSEEIPVEDHKDRKEIPTTYVPARNTIFLSIAMGWAESLEAYDLFIGACETDHAGYPDCRGIYFDAMQELFKLANKTGIEGKPIKIHTPLLKKTKAETFKLGTSLKVDYSKTVTCYRANQDGQACGTCDSCCLRRAGFIEANLPDPTRYY